MDEYVPTYCCRCSNLQFQDFIGKSCQFCGGTKFIASRPNPTFSQSDRKQLKSLRIKTDEKELK